MLHIKMGVPQIIMTVCLFLRILQITRRDETTAELISTAVAAAIEIGILRWGGFY